MKRLAVVAGVGLALVAGETAAQSWSYSSRTDQFTDQRISTASGALRNGSAGLFVRCTGSRIEAYYSVRDYLDNEGARTRYRIDGGEVSSDYWDASTDGGGVFAPHPGMFARRLATGSRIVIEAEKYDGSPVTYTFSLAGSAASINRVLSDCGLPTRDPHSVDASVWPRVVSDLDSAHADDVATIQDMLKIILGDEDITDARGQKGQSTYKALSSFYNAYWSLCERGESEMRSCSSWLRSRETNPEANYPKEAIALLVEFFDETSTPEPASPS